MRWNTVLASLLFTVFTIPSVHADINSSTAWFNGLSPSKRVQLQRDLYWTGDYRGQFNGNFSPNLFSAISAFQQRHNIEATGILDSPQRNDLGAEAQRIRQFFAYHEAHQSSSSSSPRVSSRPHTVRVTSYTLRNIVQNSYLPRFLQRSSETILILP
jgi:peptidoglycan hydrolase-like protein with peptidoglycan-binding domain